MSTSPGEKMLAVVDLDTSGLVTERKGAAAYIGALLKQGNFQTAVCKLAGGCQPGKARPNYYDLRVLRRPWTKVVVHILLVSQSFSLLLRLMRPPYTL